MYTCSIPCQTALNPSSGAAAGHALWPKPAPEKAQLARTAAQVAYWQAVGDQRKKSILRGIYPSSWPSGDILFRAAARQHCAPLSASPQGFCTSCGAAQGMLDTVVDKTRDTCAARAARQLRGMPASQDHNLRVDSLSACHPVLAQATPPGCLDTGSPASSPTPHTSAVL